MWCIIMNNVPQCPYNRRNSFRRLFLTMMLNIQPDSQQANSNLAKATVWRLIWLDFRGYEHGKRMTACVASKAPLVTSRALHEYYGVVSARLCGLANPWKPVSYAASWNQTYISTANPRRDRSLQEEWPDRQAPHLGGSIHRQGQDFVQKECLHFISFLLKTSNSLSQGPNPIPYDMIIIVQPQQF